MRNWKWEIGKEELEYEEFMVFCVRVPPAAIAVV